MRLSFSHSEVHGVFEAAMGTLVEANSTFFSNLVISDSGRLQLANSYPQSLGLQYAAPCISSKVLKTETGDTVRNTSQQTLLGAFCFFACYAFDQLTGVFCPTLPMA